MTETAEVRPNKIAPPVTPETYINVPKAAKILGISVNMLYRYIWAKKGPPSVRFGRIIRIRYDDLMNWAMPGKKHPSICPHSLNGKKK